MKLAGYLSLVFSLTRRRADAVLHLLADVARMMRKEEEAEAAVPERSTMTAQS